MFHRSWRGSVLESSMLKASLLFGCALVVLTSLFAARQAVAGSAQESGALPSDQGSDSWVPVPPSATSATSGIDMYFIMHHALMAVLFGFIGMVLFGLCVLLITKLAPFSVRKEIEEDQNVSLGIIVGSMIIGIAMIISAAILG